MLYYTENKILSYNCFVFKAHNLSRNFVKKHYSKVIVTEPKNCLDVVKRESTHGGADVVIEVAGEQDTFKMAWQKPYI